MKNNLEMLFEDINSIYIKNIDISWGTRFNIKSREFYIEVEGWNFTITGYGLFKGQLFIEKYEHKLLIEEELTIDRIESLIFGITGKVIKLK